MNIPQNPSALYLSHGGGPLPVLGDDGHKEMVDVLKSLAQNIRKPSAIIVISAHWEERVATVIHRERPSVIYDYYGFPREAYQLEYPALGNPSLAEDVSIALGAHRIEARLDDDRGFDHGLYIPLMLMYPEADIPCIQVSLVSGLEPIHHIRIGEAISHLAKNGVLVIGSGFSFHNLKAFAEADSPDSRAMNEAFDDWLIDTCSSTSIDEDERVDRLVNWEKAPHARYCHPREEHLLPLHVCYGVARRVCGAYLELSIMNKKASMYLW